MISISNKFFQSFNVMDLNGDLENFELKEEMDKSNSLIMSIRTDTY